ncbi:MAG: insulinase family protein [Bacteroidetes bacterium]|nr:insulinase family protein [Bacteroidota bacterium]
MKNVVVLFFILGFLSFSNAQKLDLKDKLTLDPNVRYGKLDNGLTYYIQVNKKPEKRAQLMLAVNTGSVSEDDDQQGLAHFTEHMAFNGIPSFPNNKLDEYLESVGIKKSNAYTSFDRTVYYIETQTDKDDVFGNCMQIIKEWSHDEMLDSVEIDKERGVIIEEWRLGQGAEERMRNKYRPVLMKDSRYADRLPIGKKEILESFKYNTIRKFYKDWYRPDNFAVIVVGDIDADKVEKMIKAKFGDISKVNNPRKVQEYEVPDHKETRIAKVTDKEASRTTLMISYKHPKEETNTVADYRRQLVYSLYNSMLNKRLSELQKQADPPFTFAYTYFGRMVKTKNNYVSYAMVSEKGIERGIETLVTENERVKKYGFTSTELERNKKEQLRDMEQEYNERDKTESNNLSYQLVENFLNHEPAPGIETEYELYKKYLPMITLEEMNALAKKWITDGENLVVVIQAPEKEGVALPSDDKILSIIKDIQKKDIKPYQDNISTKPLVSVKPKGSKIIEEKKIDEAGITRWKLENGIQVIFKITDFKNDEIVFSASSWGGWSLYPENEHLTASNAAGIIAMSGLGEFTKIQLDKYLTGKIAYLSPSISETKQGFRGSASPQDIETALQMVYMYFTQPRKDTAAFKSFIERQRTSLQNKSAKPENVFYDSVRYVMAQKNYRYRPMNEEMLKEIDLNRAYDIFRERFSDASGFTFYFVGNIKPETFKPLVETYLGGIPAGKKKEIWKDVGVRNPKGIIEKTIYKGKDPKSSVVLFMTGDFDWIRKNRMDANAVSQLINVKLRDAVREEKGGTYGIYSFVNPSRFPVSVFSTAVQWGCSPDRADELIKVAMQVIEDIKTKGAEDIDVTKVKEMLKKERETNIKENEFWLSYISGSYENEENVLDIFEYDKFLESISSESLKQSAIKYYDKTNFAKFLMMPEKQ